MAAPAIVAPVVTAPVPESAPVAPAPSADLAVPPVEDWSEEYAARERLWTGEDLERAYELGLFSPDEKYELLEGHLFRKMPQKNPHFIAIELAIEALKAAFGEGFKVFGQAPVNESPSTKPEPDVMVVPGTTRDWDGRDIAPADVLLAVEVSDTTLRFDRGYKAGLYARLGFKEVWIVDLNGRRVELRRGPMADGGWALTQIVGEDGALAVPGSERTIPVSDVLPKATE